MKLKMISDTLSIMKFKNDVLWVINIIKLYSEY